MKAIATLEIERMSLVSDGVGILGTWLRVVFERTKYPAFMGDYYNGPNTSPSPEARLFLSGKAVKPGKIRKHTSLRPGSRVLCPIIKG